MEQRGRMIEREALGTAAGVLGRTHGLKSIRVRCHILTIITISIALLRILNGKLILTLNNSKQIEVSADVATVIIFIFF